MWQLLLECLLYFVNLITILGLSWHAFRQSERIKSLNDEIMQLENENDELNRECGRHAELAWNRLSDAEKDAAIRIG